MHIKICNVTKLIGVDMAMVNLAGIDNMMTNFNQIVIQEGIINKYYFCFDLPVHQLSTMQPAISNNLVVKTGKNVSYQNRQPYCYPQQDTRLLDSSAQAGLWNLLDEFKRG